MNEILPYNIRIMAQTYDDGVYGSSTYNGETGQNTNTTADSGTTQNLPNTGMDVMIGVGIGVLLIILGVLLVIKLRSQKKSKMQP